MIIAIVPPYENAQELAVDEGLYPDKLHITMFHYMEETPEIVLGVMEALALYTQDAQPFGVVISQLGKFELVKKVCGRDGVMFNAEEPTDVIFGKVDSIHLSEERENLKKILDEVNSPYSQTFKEFKPHLTLKYVPHGENLKQDTNFPFSFMVKELQIWLNSGEKTTFTFRGNNNYDYLFQTKIS